ncbi:MAG: magnesium chelatase, partial [Frankiales bacterium]|nr:magnesium chelatase [Frankiales bacterium]
ARYTRLVRESPQVDQRSGVSARFAVASAETVAASAVRRAAITGETQAVARVCDLPSVVAASRGKVEFESAEEGRELEVLHHLLRRATADAFRALLAGTDLSGLQGCFDEGATVETGDLVPAADLLGRLGTIPGLSTVLARLGVEQESPGLVAAAVEFALEGLHLNRRLAKDEVAGKTVYGR